MRTVSFFLGLALGILVAVALGFAIDRWGGQGADMRFVQCLATAAAAAGVVRLARVRNKSAAAVVGLAMWVAGSVLAFDLAGQHYRHAYGPLPAIAVARWHWQGGPSQRNHVFLAPSTAAERAISWALFAMACTMAAARAAARGETIPFATRVAAPAEMTSPRPGRLGRVLPYPQPADADPAFDLRRYRKALRFFSGVWLLAAVIFSLKYSFGDIADPEALGKSVGVAFVLCLASLSYLGGMGRLLIVWVAAAMGLQLLLVRHLAAHQDVEQYAIIWRWCVSAAWLAVALHVWALLRRPGGRAGDAVFPPPSSARPAHREGVF